ncbi:MAG: hypothetical protein ACF8MJ_08735 [Phycisphaerales bacterium JB050]
MTESVISVIKIKTRIDQLTREIGDLNAQRRALIELLNEFAPESDGSSDRAITDKQATDASRAAFAQIFQPRSWPPRRQTISSEEARAGTDSTRALRPKDAILNLLAHEPNLTISEVIDRLEGRVNTKSKDLANVLRTTASRLVGNEEVYRDSSGRLRLNKEGPS